MTSRLRRSCSAKAMARRMKWQTMARVSDVLRRAGATDIKVSQNEAERLRYWSSRKNAFRRRVASRPTITAWTAPSRVKLPRVLNEIERLSGKYRPALRQRVSCGDGNLHPLIMFDANVPGELERAEEFGAEILELCVEVGGPSPVSTAWHRKINQMCVQFSPKELARMHEIKHAFDEHGLLNPGKAGTDAAPLCRIRKDARWGKPMPFAGLAEVLIRLVGRALPPGEQNAGTHLT